MPPVFELYDQAPPPAARDTHGYCFTRDVARALSAPDKLVDFDDCVWARGADVKKQTFGLRKSVRDDRAVVMMLFTYRRIGGGTDHVPTLCRKVPNDWKIQDMNGEAGPEPSDGPAAGEAVPSLRRMPGLPAASPTCPYGPARIPGRSPK